MKGQLQLTAEQVIIAIQQLGPVEKREVQRRLPYLLGIPEYMALPRVESERKTTPKELHQYAFSEVRHLLRNVQSAISEDIIRDRKDRI